MSDVLEFWSGDNSSIESILDVLETIYLIFRKTIVQQPIEPNSPNKKQDDLLLIRTEKKDKVLSLKDTEI